MSNNKSNPYLYIVNPKTNRKVSIYGKTGLNILKKYMSNKFILNGG